MSTDENNQDPAEGTNGGEGTPEVEKIPLSKQEYEELIGLKADYGSLKRDYKDLKKAHEEATKTPKTPEQNQNSDGSALLKKAFLRSAGLADSEEQELAISLSEKWGLEVDKLVDDEDFKMKLERHRTAKANAVAVSGIPRGGGSPSEQKNSTDYWKAKGTPPTPADVPDSKTRRKIIRELVSSSESKGIKFYNE